MPLIKPDFLYLGICADDKDRCCGQSHRPCHRLSLVTPNPFTAAGTQRLPAASADACYCCHAEVAFDTSLQLRLNDDAQSQIPSTSILTVQPTIRPTTYQMYNPHDKVAECPSTQPAELNGFVSDGDCYSWMHTYRDASGFRPHPGQAGSRRILPAAWHGDMPQYMPIGDADSILSPVNMGPQGAQATLSSVLNLDVDQIMQSPPTSFHPASNRCRAFQGPLQHDAALPAFQSTETVVFGPEDTLLFEPTGAAGYSMTPDNSLEALTPCLNGQTPLLSSIYGWDDFGAMAIPNDDLLSPRLAYDFDTFVVEPDYGALEPLYPDAALPEYPPLPDLDASIEDAVQDTNYQHNVLHGCKFPAWYFEERLSGPLDDEAAQCRGQPSTRPAIATPSSQLNDPATSGQKPGAKNRQRDSSKDDFLVSCKAQGMSYKQIKEAGGFEEAESTLRGRFRALTKPREARLRKPAWGEREVRLLFEGVHACSRSILATGQPGHELDAISMGQFVNKVPWKQVAEYMERKGAYRYGNATVKKKYLDVLKSRGDATGRGGNGVFGAGIDKASSAFLTRQAPRP